MEKQFSAFSEMSKIMIKSMKEEKKIVGSISACPIISLILPAF
ncbi:MAG: hypothetical protein WCJ01_08565 [Ignavibacteria bacterium]